MKLDYSLKVYNKDWRIVREIPIDKKAHEALKVIIRLPNKVSLKTFAYLSFPITATDIPLVEKTTGFKLNTKRDHYVLEIRRV